MQNILKTIFEYLCDRPIKKMANMVLNCPHRCASLQTRASILETLKMFCCVCCSWKFAGLEIILLQRSPHSLLTGNLCIFGKPTIAFEPIAAVRGVSRGHGKWVLVAKTIAACLWSFGRAWAGEGHFSRALGSSLKRGNELESGSCFSVTPHPPPLFFLLPPPPPNLCPNDTQPKTHGGRMA